MNEEIKILFKTINKLKENYKHHKKNFTLDGKLVGDIGEVLVAEHYGLTLYGDNTPVYDGYVTEDESKKVQIKASFKGNSYFPYGEDKIPDYFLAIKILENGELEELFNGPGKYVFEHYIIKRNLKHYKETYYTLSKGVLKELNGLVDESEKIKKVK